MSRRLLATLSSLPSPTTTAKSPLLPPYTHTTQPSLHPSSLKPPYTHSLDRTAVSGPSRLNAPYRFSLLPSANTESADDWASWAKGLISDDGSRVEVERVWQETLQAIEQAKLDKVSHVRSHG
jgi:hypothetical protein